MLLRLKFQDPKGLNKLGLSQMGDKLVCRSNEDAVMILASSGLCNHKDYEVESSFHMLQVWIPWKTRARI